MTDPHFQRLLDRYLDGGLDAGELAEFERMLLSDQQARAEFWQQAHLHDALRRQAGESWGMRAAHDDRQQRHASLRRVVAIAALIVATLTILFLVTRPATESAVGLAAEPSAGAPPSGLPPRPIPSPPLVAVISELAGAVWGAPGEFRKGEAIEPGELAIRSGLVGLTFFNGAHVTVEGPARLSLLSDSSMRLHSGNVRIECPEVAHGFTVITPSGRVIDLGTVFGLSVGDDGTAEVRVVEGLVTMRGNAEESDTELRKQAVAGIDATGRVRLRAKAARSDPESFVQDVRVRERQRFENWREASARRVGDKDLLVYLRMLNDEGSANRLLANEGGSEAASSTAPVISVNWVEGRWPGKRALLFQSASERARVSIDGRYPRVTFAAWVRIAGFQRPFNALFMSDCNLDGEVHWQFSQSGGNCFAVRPSPAMTRSLKWSGGRLHRAWDDEMLRPSDNGVWRHLVTSYDADEQVIIHYLDGREVGRHTLPERILLAFGRCTIGNTSYATEQYWGPRQFGGAVDEFAIYSRVLDPAEVATLYEEGRPE